MHASGSEAERMLLAVAVSATGADSGASRAGSRCSEQILGSVVQLIPRADN
jgi:hypothetical protein